MKSKHLLLTLLLAFLVPWAASAQETVTIGDGTVTCNTNPIGTYYNYSIAEQLYTAEEIGMAGTISSVSFYYKGNAAKDLPITMYMKHVNEADLSSGGISLADATEVFSGTLSVTTTAGWVTIDLDTPFDYDGTSNLLIGFIKDYLYYFSGQTWQGTATTATMARYTQNDYNGYDTSTVPGTAQANRPNIQLVIEPASSDCPKPASLVASDVTAHTAVLTWVSEATQFMLQYKKASDESWTTEYPEEETTYTLTGLDPETTYQARVAAHVESCGIDPQTGNDIYSDWREIEFTTGIACPAPTNLAVTPESIAAREATVTWEGTSNSYVVMIGQENLVASANFETGDLSQANFTTTTSYPFTVVANTHSGSYCAKSGNGGVNSSTSDMVLEVTLSADATLSFSAKVSSEGSWDKAYFSIDGTVQSNLSAISGNGDWIDYSYPLTAGTHTLRWYYTKDGSSASNDDCFYVDDIVISAGVDSWNENTTNNTTYTFENLTPNRSYQVKVKGNCGDEGYSQATAPVSFTTLASCIAPTGLAMVAGYPTAHEVSFTWDYQTGEVFQFALVQGHVTDPSEVNFNTTWNAGDNFPMWNTLSADTDWSFFLRKNCDGDFSDPVYVNFHTPEACPAPTGFAAMPNSITAHTANLTWQGTSNSYQVAYRTAAYVDGVEEGFGSTSNPEGWTRYNTLLTDEVLNGTTALTTYAGGWNFGTSNGVFDSHARVNIYGTSCKYWLVTPTLTVPAGAALNFDLALTAYSGTGAASGTCDDDRFVILISIDDMQHWTILREWNNTGSNDVYNNIPTAGQNVSIDITTYVGQDVRIAFYGESTVSGNGDNNLHIDNVNIGLPVAAGEWQYMTEITETICQLTGLLAERKYEATLQGDCEDEGVSTVVGPITFTTDVACPAPTGLTASNISAHEATISWTSAADAWQICVNDDEENLIDVTETTYNFTGLAPETAYTVKVRTNCGDEGYSDWTNNVTFTTEEACPMNINNVTVNYITNNEATVAWEGTHDNYQVQTRQIVVPEGSYYDDFENGLDNWTIYQEGEAGGNWSITNPSNWSGSYAAHSGSYVAVARSWNSSAFNADNWLVSPQVTIPDSMSYWMMGDAGYPETYDICVSITGNAVADFTSVVTYTENPSVWTKVTVDLSDFAGQTGYIAFHQYGYDADFLWIDDVNIGCTTGEWMTVETTDLAAELTGLAPGTPYEYQVRGYCADEDTWTDWTNMAIFNTLDVCATPENLVVTSGAESATATWTGVQSSYNVYWGVYDGSTTNYNNQALGVTATNYTIEGLISGAQYGVKVEGVCSELNVSDPIETTFSTAVLWTDPQVWNNPENPDYNGNPEQSAPEVITVTENTVVVIPENTVIEVNQIVMENGSEIIIEEGSELIYSVNVEDPENPTPAELSQGVPVTMSMNIEAPTRDNSGYRLIASPIYETIGVEDCGLTANYYGMDLYSFDANYPQAEWRNYKTGNNFSELEIGKGYLYYNSETVFVTFAGQTIPSNVIYPIDLAWSENAYYDEWKGLNLIGNPFTCKATPDRDFYVLNEAGDEIMTTVSTEAYVAPMKGFFVLANNDQDLVCQMEKYTEPTQAALNMTLNQNQNLVDRAVVKFGKGENLRKVQLNSNHTKLYMPLDSYDYATMYTDSNVGEMPVNFKAEHSGSYTMSFANDNVEFSYLHLIDNMTGNDVDLLANPSYSFEAKTTDYASRFRLVYATGSSVDGDSFAFINGMGNLCIFGIEGEATLQVMDVLGHVISSNQFSGSFEQKLNVAPGVYMIRLINGNDVKVQKIVVK